MKREGLRHPKTLDLMDRLGINRREAIGLLDLLLDWAIDYAPCGDVGKWSNAVIATAIDWTGNADELVEALVGSGWLDKNRAHRIVIHDWPQHAPNFLRAKLKKLGLSFLDCYSSSVGSYEGSDESLDESSEATTPPLSSPPCPSPPASSSSSPPERTDDDDDEVVSEDEWNQAKPIANRLLKGVFPNGIKPKPSDYEWLARVAVLGVRYGPRWIEPGFEALKTPNLDSPISMLTRVLDDECQRLQTRLGRELCRIKVPPAFLPNSKPQPVGAN